MTTAYTRSIRRNVSTSEERHGGVLVRRYFEDGKFIRADIFNATGWRDTIVKTERGICNAVARLSR